MSGQVDFIQGKRLTLSGHFDPGLMQDALPFFGVVFGVRGDEVVKIVFEKDEAGYIFK